MQGLVIVLSVRDRYSKKMKSQRLMEWCKNGGRWIATLIGKAWNVQT
jgi:hypothetical protein